MVPMSVEQDADTPTTFATGFPCFVITIPDAGKSSISLRHFSLKSVTDRFMRLVYIKPLQLYRLYLRQAGNLA